MFASYLHQKITFLTVCEYLKWHASGSFTDQHLIGCTFLSVLFPILQWTVGGKFLKYSFKVSNTLKSHLTGNFGY